MLSNMNTNHRTKVDAIDVTARDWRPTSRDVRAELHKAITKAADDHDGLVHIADVRKLLPS